MIKKRWKRVLLTLGILIATAHLYLTLFAVQKNTYVHGGRHLDAFNIRSTLAAHLSNFSSLSLKTARTSNVRTHIALKTARTSNVGTHIVNYTVQHRSSAVETNSVNSEVRTNQSVIETNNVLYEVRQRVQHATRRHPRTSNTPVTVKDEGAVNTTLLFGRGRGADRIADRVNATQVLIVAYIRSGSSLTGDILQQDPHSFYVYEPLHFTDKHGVKIHHVQQMDGTVVNIERKHFIERAYTVFGSYFDCDFATLDFGTLVHGFQTFGNKTNDFIKCYVNNTGHRMSKQLSAQVCGLQLQDVCQRSKFRVIKTIRVPMIHVDPLLQRYPNLKVIHLVRDPRAQINSIDLLANTTKYNKGFAKQKCSAMNKDFYYSEQYRSRYPGRVMRLYYEDLASEPIKTSALLYEFTGMNFSTTVRDYINGITNTRHDGCSICSKRANSTEHVEKWRQNLKFSEVKLIDKQCRETYGHFGFLPARTRSVLRDLSVPLRHLHSEVMSP